MDGNCDSDMSFDSCPWLRVYISLRLLVLSRAWRHGLSIQAAEALAACAVEGTWGRAREGSVAERAHWPPICNHMR